MTYRFRMGKKQNEMYFSFWSASNQRKVRFIPEGKLFWTLLEHVRKIIIFAM